MRKKETRAQLLKKAAEARREARIMMGTLHTVEGKEAVARHGAIQRLYDKAAALKSRAAEPGR